MPTIDPNLIPTVNPGSLFFLLSSQNSLTPRWLTAADPHYFDVYNRPMADIVVRQLIIAKSLDQVGLRLSHQSLFPFLISPTIDVGTSKISLPLSWLWDSHVSLKDSYLSVRLATIIRLDGINPTGGPVPGSNGSNGSNGDGYTGTLRLVFTGVLKGGVEEIGLFYADYQIDSSLSFQIATIVPCTAAQFNPPAPTTDNQTFAGYIVFRTLDPIVDSTFLNAVAPSIGSSGTTGETATYEISDTVVGGIGVIGDYSLPAIPHGTGMLVPSAYNLIPPAGIDYNSVLNALNYPWRSGTNLDSAVTVGSAGIITIPSSLFSQFVISAPIGNRDNATDQDIYPVICTKINRLDASADNLQFIFSTYNTRLGDDNKTLIDFASLTLKRGSAPGTIVDILPIASLIDNTSSDWQTFLQNFGSGYVILCDSWTISSSEIGAFFNEFLQVANEPAVVPFTAQLGEFAIARSPLQIPTLGQAAAAIGSTARRTNPIHPSDANRFVTESDQGLGDKVDLTAAGFEGNSDIDQYGYVGALLRRSITLRVNAANDANFDYNNDILPRLVKLLGRDPIHGDEWFDGVIWKRFDGLSGTWIG